MAEGTMRFAVAGEDRRHFDVIKTLVDGELATLEWLRDVLDSVRSWDAGTGGSPPYMKVADSREWTSPVAEIDGIRVRMLGHIGGKPVLPEANQWRKVLARLLTQDPRPDLVVLVRDLDGHPERRAGMEQALDPSLHWPATPVLLATPEPEMEGWVVSGFVAETAGERQTLAQLTRELSFDPTTQSHRLTSHPNDAAADAKRVLSRLTGDELEREQRCLADREILGQRGHDNYCREFLGKVRETVKSRFGGRPTAEESL